MHEYPCSPDLRAGDLALAGFSLQRDRMDIAGNLYERSVLKRGRGHSLKISENQGVGSSNLSGRASFIKGLPKGRPFSFGVVRTSAFDSGHSNRGRGAGVRLDRFAKRMNLESMATGPIQP